MVDGGRQIARSIAGSGQLNHYAKIGSHSTRNSQGLNHRNVIPPPTSTGIKALLDKRGKKF